MTPNPAQPTREQREGGGAWPRAGAPPGTLLFTGPAQKAPSHPKSKTRSYCFGFEISPLRTCLRQFAASASSPDHVFPNQAGPSVGLDAHRLSAPWSLVWTAVPGAVHLLFGFGWDRKDRQQ